MAAVTCDLGAGVAHAIGCERLALFIVATGAVAIVRDRQELVDLAQRLAEAQQHRAAITRALKGRTD